MFVIKYSEFINSNFYSDFSISYMSGLKISSIDTSNVIINIDEKTAFVYSE